MYNADGRENIGGFEHNGISIQTKRTLIITGSGDVRFDTQNSRLNPIEKEIHIGCSIDDCESIVFNPHPSINEFIIIKTVDYNHFDDSIKDIIPTPYKSLNSMMGEMAIFSHSGNIEKYESEKIIGLKIIPQKFEFQVRRNMNTKERIDVYIYRG